MLERHRRAFIKPRARVLSQKHDSVLSILYHADSLLRKDFRSRGRVERVANALEADEITEAWQLEGLTPEDWRELGVSRGYRCAIEAALASEDFPDPENIACAAPRPTDSAGTSVIRFPSGSPRAPSSGAASGGMGEHGMATPSSLSPAEIVNRADAHAPDAPAAASPASTQRQPAGDLPDDLPSDLKEWLGTSSSFRSGFAVWIGPAPPARATARTHRGNIRHDGAH